MANLGETLRKLRESVPGLTLEAVGDWFGIRKESVYGWEELGKKPKLDKLAEIARRYGCTVDELLDGTAVVGPDAPVVRDLPEHPSKVGDVNFSKRYSEHSSTQVVGVRAVIRLAKDGEIHNVAQEQGGVQMIRTDKLHRPGNYYALLVSSSDNIVVRRGAAVLVRASAPVEMDQLAVVTMRDGRHLLMGTMLDQGAAMKFESMSGSIVTLLKDEIERIEPVEAIDLKPGL